MGQSLQGWHGQGKGQGLDFIEQNYAVGQPVQLPACTGPVGKEGFQHLDAGRYDQRRISVLGQFAAQ